MIGWGVTLREVAMPIRSSIRSTAGRGRLFDSIIDTVGDTPTIRINNLGVAGRTIYAKAEFFNPAASVKDRLALNIIEEGERSGALKPGQTVVEATSGNTGIGLAMVCAQKGYPLVVTMADSFSVERRKLMRMLGAKVVLTPRALKGFGMYQKAVELAEANGWFLAHQFETKANADIHEATTAREIISDFAGMRLDWFVTGYGTGGTVVGVGRVLRRERPNVRIVLCEPANASLVSDGRPQARNPDGSPAASHPAWEPHPIQGWTPDFIPLVLQEAIDASSTTRSVRSPAPRESSGRRSWRKRRAFSPASRAARPLGSRDRIAETAPDGSVILCMLPDTGERYLTTPLFDGIEAEMNAEETALSRSTPSAQFPPAVTAGGRPGGRIGRRGPPRKRSIRPIGARRWRCRAGSSTTPSAISATSANVRSGVRCPRTSCRLRRADPRRPSRSLTSGAKSRRT